MTAPETTLSCHRIVGGCGQGEALVTNQSICFYHTDPRTGLMKERGHDLEGTKLAKKVLVFPSGKGSSVVQVDGLFRLSSNGVAPKALIVKEVETVLVVSAVLAGIPLVDRLERDPFKAIHTGDIVKVDAERGKVIIKGRRPRIVSGH